MTGLEPSRTAMPDPAASPEAPLRIDADTRLRLLVDEYKPAQQSDGLSHDPDRGFALFPGSPDSHSGMIIARAWPRTKKKGNTA
jgi:hypothetical protein